MWFYLYTVHTTLLCAMTEQIIREWLADYAALSSAEVHTFASTVHLNEEVISAVYTVLEERHKFQSVSFNNFKIYLFYWLDICLIL